MQNIAELYKKTMKKSRVHNRLAVVIGAGSLVEEVATALAGQAQQ